MTAGQSTHRVRQGKHRDRQRTHSMRHQALRCVRPFITVIIEKGDLPRTAYQMFDGIQGCRGPVHAQFVENWVAYHYFDVSNHRWEMSVLELYNKAQGNVTITDMVLGKTNNTMSSYDPMPVEVGRSLRSLQLPCLLASWGSSLQSCLRHTLIRGTFRAF